VETPNPPLDPVRLEVFRHLFTALTEEMGASLRRSAHSPNIKERRDYSCALFDGGGRVVAMGDHMPVHLGAMPMSVAAALEHVAPLAEGDVVILNDPFRGGTHLPDITAIATGDLTGDGSNEVVVCSDAGQVRALAADGPVLWSWQEDRATINAIACADVNGDGRAEVIFGGDGQRLGLLSADGEELWTVNPPKFRGIQSDVMTVLPADLDGDGLPEIVCGVKSWQYFAYDGEGEIIWKNTIYAHSATVGHADDFDGDGLPEIVGGNEYYTLNLIDNNGKRIFNAGRLGPDQTAISSADVDGDGVPEILAGVDDGTLLCFGTDRQTRWTANLGDKITRIAPLVVGGELRIICAAESANVYALNGAGETVWRTPLPDGSTDLALAEVGERTLICAAAGTAGLYVLDADGELIARGDTQAPARNVTVIGARAVVTTSTGTVQAFDLL